LTFAEEAEDSWLLVVPLPVAVEEGVGSVAEGGILVLRLIDWVGSVVACWMRFVRLVVMVGKKGRME
jgi:hypothetical protein